MSQLPVPLGEELALRRRRAAPALPLVVDDGAGGDGTEAEAAPRPGELRVVVGAPQVVIQVRLGQHGVLSAHRSTYGPFRVYILEVARFGNREESVDVMAAGLRLLRL